MQDHGLLMAVFVKTKAQRGVSQNARIGSVGIVALPRLYAFTNWPLSFVSRREGRDKDRCEDQHDGLARFLI